MFMVQKTIETTVPLAQKKNLGKCKGMIVSLAWLVLLLSAMYLWFRGGYEYGQDQDRWTHSLMMSCLACFFLVAAAFVNKHFE